jgi:hypothetical protein
MRSYEPPSVAEVPTPDAALFLTAIDHRTGYERSHRAGGDEHDGSALLWALGLEAEAASPGRLSSGRLSAVTADEVRELFAVDGDEVAGPEVRARLWRDLAAGLAEGYNGEAGALISAAAGRLAGAGGLLERLAGFEAFSDPLEKKSFLVSKIWERRGWLEVADPESWQVCADNVLMRLALRSGLIEAGDAEQVRAATRDAWKRVSELSGVSPPVLDDLLWERGREDPDLVGADAGDLREPPRPEGTFYY